MVNDATFIAPKQSRKPTDAEIRTAEQNARMWAMLGDLAKQVPWPVWYEGRCEVRKMDSESWKHVLTAGLEKSQRMAQGIDGGMVLLGQSTRKMGVRKMTKLIELIQFFGDSKGVNWSDPKWRSLVEAENAGVANDAEHEVAA